MHAQSINIYMYQEETSSWHQMEQIILVKATKLNCVFVYNYYILLFCVCDTNMISFVKLNKQLSFCFRNKQVLV